MHKELVASTGMQ